MLGRGVDQMLHRKTPDYPWGDTLSLFHRADARICNLECVLSDRGKPWSEYPKAFHFRSAAKNIAVLAAAGINAVSIANNHVLDYGYEALLEMLQILDSAHIAHSGAGANLAGASQIATFQVQGRRLGLVAFTDNEPPWEATPDRPGTLYVPVDLQDQRAYHLLELIRGRPQVDVLIVSAHWGGNWGYTPPPEHVQFAQALIDAGASIVLGHSSHVFRGIEFYKQGMILYGLGDFVDDYAVDPDERNDQSFIFLVEVADAGPERARLYPTTISYCQAHRATQTEAPGIAVKMQKLCADLGTPARWDTEQQHLEITPQKLLR
jgi:poly-gamma-glutamate synthesis protein (capsule biosynthesis protein)